MKVVVFLEKGHSRGKCLQGQGRDRSPIVCNPAELPHTPVWENMVPGFLPFA